MSSLTGFMQFVAADKKNIKALVNTFFLGTEQGELLICLFELPKNTAYISGLRECGRCALNEC